MKTSIKAAFICLLFSCSHVEVAPIRAPELMPIVEAQKSKAFFKFTPSKIASELEKKQIERLQKKVNDVVNGECFKREMLKPGLKLNETTDSPEVVFNKISTAKVSAQISYYSKRFTSAVAYAENGTFYFNRAKIGSLSDCDFASTALHESTHLDPLEYSHAFNDYKGRDFTVPYYMNQIMEKCCK